MAEEVKKKFEEALAAMADDRARAADDGGQSSSKVEMVEEAKKNFEAALAAMSESQARVAEARSKHGVQVERSEHAKTLAQIAQIEAMVMDMDAQVVRVQVRYNRASRAAKDASEKLAGLSLEAEEAQQDARRAAEYAESKIGNPELEEEALLAKADAEVFRTIASAKHTQKLSAAEEAATEQSELGLARIELQIAKDNAQCAKEYLVYAKRQAFTGQPLPSIADFQLPSTDALSTQDTDAMIPGEPTSQAALDVVSQDQDTSGPNPFLSEVTVSTSQDSTHSEPLPSQIAPTTDRETSNDNATPGNASNAVPNHSLVTAVERVPINPTEVSNKTTIVSPKYSNSSSQGLENSDCTSDNKEVENTKMDMADDPAKEGTEADVSKVQVEVGEKSSNSTHERRSQFGNFEGEKHLDEAESKEKSPQMLPNVIQKSEKSAIALKLAGELDSDESNSTALTPPPALRLEGSEHRKIASSSALQPEFLPKKCDRCDARDNVGEDGKSTFLRGPGGYHTLCKMCNLDWLTEKTAKEMFHRMPTSKSSVDMETKSLAELNVSAPSFKPGSTTPSELAPSTQASISKRSSNLKRPTPPLTPAKPSSPTILPNTDNCSQVSDQAELSPTETEKSQSDAQSPKENRESSTEDSSTNKQISPVAPHPAQASESVGVSSHTSRTSESSKKSEERPRPRRGPYGEILGDSSSKRGSPKRGSNAEAPPRRGNYGEGPPRCGPYGEILGGSYSNRGYGTQRNNPRDTNLRSGGRGGYSGTHYNSPGEDANQHRRFNPSEGYARPPFNNSHNNARFNSSWRNGTHRLNSNTPNSPLHPNSNASTQGSYANLSSSRGNDLDPVSANRDATYSPERGHNPFSSSSKNSYGSRQN